MLTSSAEIEDGGANEKKKAWGRRARRKKVDNWQIVEPKIDRVS
jgi:hypothetical protein